MNIKSLIAYFNEKLYSYCIIFETNKYIDRNGYLLDPLAVKVILRKWRTKCLWIFKGRKSETTMAHQKKYRNIQSMQQARMNHACCIGLNCGWAFCPNLQPFTYWQLKQHQETKINKTRLFLPLILSTNLIKRKSKIAYL